MSSAALRAGVVEWLKAQLQFKDNECALQNNGGPEPSSGVIYVSVHPGKWIAKHVDYGIDERYGIQITISIRGSQFQWDRWGDRITGITADGLDAVSRRIIAQIHQKNGPLESANRILEGRASQLIVGEYLEFEEGSIPKDQPPSWWMGTNQKNPANNFAGMSQTLTFFGARRVQAIAELE